MIAIMQPTLFPWVGYFDLIDQSKVFILFNDVQFMKRSWQSRNRISTPNGILQITIPTVKCSQTTKIEDVFLKRDNNWNKNLVKTLENNFSKAKHYETVMEWMISFLDREFYKLQDFHSAFIRELACKIGIITPIKFSSEIHIKSINRVEKFIEYSQLHEVSIYLSPTGSFAYLENENAGEKFKKANMEIVFHHYEPVKYETGKLPFEPFMSVIDALFHCGFDEILSVIRAGRKSNYSFNEFKKLRNV